MGLISRQPKMNLFLDAIRGGDKNGFTRLGDCQLSISSRHLPIKASSCISSPALLQIPGEEPFIHGSNPEDPDFRRLSYPPILFFSSQVNLKQNTIEKSIYPPRNPIINTIDNGRKLAREREVLGIGDFEREARELYLMNHVRSRSA